MTDPTALPKAETVDEAVQAIRAWFEEIHLPPTASGDLLARIQAAMERERNADGWIKCLCGEEVWECDNCGKKVKHGKAFWIDTTAVRRVAEEMDAIGGFGPRLGKLYAAELRKAIGEK